MSEMRISDPKEIKRTRTKLPPEEEASFRNWYARKAKELNLNKDPDGPDQKYDYRGAYKAGHGPSRKDGHWPSEFKDDDHPNRFVKFPDGSVLDSKKNKIVKKAKDSDR